MTVPPPLGEGRPDKRGEIAGGGGGYTSPMCSNVRHTVVCACVPALLHMFWG